jgi:hypothetical protein
MSASPLAELVTSKATRAAFRSAQYRLRRREKRQAERQTAAVQKGLLTWDAVYIPFVQQPDPPAPRRCQWLEAGLFCGAPVARPGCSYCREHAAIVFATPEA